MENIITQDGLIHTEVGELDLTGWEPKIERRTKNRMKITFKLNQDQAAAYESFKSSTMPDTITETQFVTSIFFMGLASLESQIIATAQAELESENVDLDAIIEEAEAQAVETEE